MHLRSDYFITTKNHVRTVLHTTHNSIYIYKFCRNLRSPAQLQLAAVQEQHHRQHAARGPAVPGERPDAWWRRGHSPLPGKRGLVQQRVPDFQEGRNAGEQRPLHPRFREHRIFAPG